MIPTLADLRLAYPELDDARCESLLRLIERAVSDDRRQVNEIAAKGEAMTDEQIAPKEKP